VSTFLRIMRLALMALAAVVALAVTAYLVLNVSAVITAKRQRAEISNQITARISQQLPATRERGEAIAAGIGATPTHAWLAQKCGFRTNDAGWIVQNYREECLLESVHVWEVASEPEARTLLGNRVQAGTKPFVNGACQHYTVSDSLRGPDPSFESQLSFLYIAPAAEGNRWCAPVEGAYQKRRSVVGEIPALDDSRGWLVVIQSDQLVDEGIGCLHWSVIFCDNPFGDEPAWGRPPA